MFSGLENIDLVEVLFTLFWVFFIGLVIYLQREMKREGYPLVSDRSEHITVQGFPSMPAPKEFRLASGRSVFAPRDESPDEDFSAEPAAPHPGAPLDPSGDPLKARVGPGAFAKRPDVPELTLDGKPRIVPMRSSSKLHVDSADTDPRGMPVVAADGKDVGVVHDLWVDLAEPQIYFLEVRRGEGDTATRTMIPFGFADIDKSARRIRVNAIYAAQFDGVPGLSSPDQITLLEEDKIMAYFGGGLLFADERRAEPYL